jgi:hypothetical protein
MAGAEAALIVGTVFGTVAFTIWTTARVYLKRLEIQHGGGSPKLSAAMEHRLERIEQAVDAIAVEMERVSEGQRFTTKLLSERNAPQAPSADDPGPR